MGRKGVDAMNCNVTLHHDDEDQLGSLDELLASCSISLETGINKLLTGGINSEITVAFH